MTSPTTDAYVALRDRYDGYVAAAEAREEHLRERLDLVRTSLRTATDTIAKLQAELDSYRPVMVAKADGTWSGSILVDDEWVAVPVTLYAKDDHA